MTSRWLALLVWPVALVACEDDSATTPPTSEPVQSEARDASSNDLVAALGTGTAPGPCGIQGKKFEVNGIAGYPPSSLPTGACSSGESCKVVVAEPPFCGSEATELANYECECIFSVWKCTDIDSAGAVPLTGWCDGGPGTDDAGK